MTMDIDLDTVSEVGQRMIADLRARQALDRRAFLSTEDAKLLTGLRETRMRDLMAAGIFPSLLDGRSRRLAIGPLYDYLAERIAESHPFNGPPKNAGTKR
jgi:hypothetical protein